MIYTSFIRRNRVKILAATALLFCVAILNSELSPDFYFLTFDYENVSCYYEQGEELQFVTDRGFYPSVQSIFFHETSCRGGLNSRQACAIEAAAKAHKYWDIYVLFVASVRNLKTTSFRALQRYDRVKFARVNINEYAKNTPLESLVASGALYRTKWRISHTSDVLRYLTMYKWGGIYLDLDTVVVKSLGGLKNNWSARESDDSVAAGAMSFSRDPVGRMFADAAISDLVKNFRGDTWGHNGPGVITRVLTEKCGTKVMADMSSDICEGFEVYGPELFYPIRWQDASHYFEPGEISQEPYVYHVWNRLTKDIKLSNNSMYAKLAIKYCPNVYNAYGSDFGNLLILILNSNLSPDLYFINIGVSEDVSCHYEVKGDALEATNSHYTPTSNTIFFHVTSCRGNLNSREACSIESAARTHTDRVIHVLFTAPVNKISLEDVSFKLLKLYPNIKFRRVHIVEYAKKTPVEELVACGALNRTRWPSSHTSDVLRFLTLFKFGGVILDLDTVTAKPLDMSKNWAVRDSDFCMGSSALAFYGDDIGRMVADTALRDLSETFRGDVMAQNGPFLITRILKDLCGTNDLTATMTAKRCKGFEVFGPEFFQSVEADSQVSDTGDLPDQDAYIYRILSQQNEIENLKVERSPLYAMIAKKYCPVIYESFGEFFGL